MEVNQLLEFVNKFHNRVLNVANIVESAHEMSDALKRDWQRSMNDLREHFAKEKSFRKKDFDASVSQIQGFQNQQEVNVRSVLNDYISTQKKFSQKLRHIVEAVEKAKERNNKEEIREYIQSFQTLCSDIEEREKFFKKILHDYIHHQKIISDTFKKLYKNNGTISPRDFKLTIFSLIQTLKKDDGDAVPALTKAA